MTETTLIESRAIGIVERSKQLAIAELEKLVSKVSIQLEANPTDYNLATELDLAIKYLQCKDISMMLVTVSIKNLTRLIKEQDK